MCVYNGHNICVEITKSMCTFPRLFLRICEVGAGESGELIEEAKQFCAENKSNKKYKLQIRKTKNVKTTKYFCYAKIAPRSTMWKRDRDVIESEWESQRFGWLRIDCSAHRIFMITLTFSPVDVDIGLHATIRIINPLANTQNNAQLIVLFCASCSSPFDSRRT